MSWHAGAVIGVKENDGIVGYAIFFKFLEALSDLLIHCRDAVVKASNGFADGRCVWIVGWYGCFGRIVKEIFRDSRLNVLFESCVGPDRGTGLVGSHVIEHREEGLLALSLVGTPVGFVAVFVPRFFDETANIAGVVVGLHIVRRKIASFGR